MAVDERTRDAVLRLIHESRALTAASLADQLSLSPAGVRRHLEALVADGLLREVEPRSTGSRTRGRPARAYTLTEAGRSGFPHAYDDLASMALRYLRESGGDAAVRAFAEHRAEGLAVKIRSAAEIDAVPAVPGAGVGSTGGEPTAVAAVAMALADEGYAARVEPVAGGTQICQHHCPVAHVAAEFPQLCAAETEMLARVLGTYVQRLATIAHGDGVCTTFVPNRDDAPRTGVSPTPQLSPSGRHG